MWTRRRGAASRGGGPRVWGAEAPRGWDSRVYGHGELFYCPMCMELVPVNLKSSLGPCGHAFCSSCVTMYVAVKQRQDGAGVKCPDCENGVPVFVTDHTEGDGDLPADGRGEPFDCAICMETLPGTLKFSVSSCAHAFCRGCVAQYVAAKLDDKLPGTLKFR